MWVGHAARCNACVACALSSAGRCGERARDGTDEQSDGEPRAHGCCQNNANVRPAVYLPHRLLTRVYFGFLGAGPRTTSTTRVPPSSITGFIDPSRASNWSWSTCMSSIILL